MGGGATLEQLGGGCVVDPAAFVAQACVVDPAAFVAQAYSSAESRDRHGKLPSLVSGWQRLSTASRLWTNSPPCPGSYCLAQSLTQHQSASHHPWRVCRSRNPTTSGGRPGPLSTKEFLCDYIFLHSNIDTSLPVVAFPLGYTAVPPDQSLIPLYAATRSRLRPPSVHDP